MITPMEVSNARVRELDSIHLFYCNELPWRCSNPRCRDCSTAVADIVNASGAGINSCSTSFSLSHWAFDAYRPEWFTEQYGRFPGTFISREDAMHIPSVGIEGSNWGRNEINGKGHAEWIVGNGTPLTWGAHSHASGVGYDPDGLYGHGLDFFFVPPHFIPWLVPPVKIDWEFLKEVEEFKLRVSVPRQVGPKGKRITGNLHYGDRGKDVLILKKILAIHGYPGVDVPGDRFGIRLRRAVHNYKIRNGWASKNQSGSVVGAAFITSILK